MQVFRKGFFPPLCIRVRVLKLTFYLIRWISLWNSYMCPWRVTTSALRTQRIKTCLYIRCVSDINGKAVSAARTHNRKVGQGCVNCKVGLMFLFNKQNYKNTQSDQCLGSTFGNGSTPRSVAGGDFVSDECCTPAADRAIDLEFCSAANKMNMTRSTVSIPITSVHW